MLTPPSIRRNRYNVGTALTCVIVLSLTILSQTNVKPLSVVDSGQQTDSGDHEKRALLEFVDIPKDMRGKMQDTNRKDNYNDNDILSDAKLLQNIPIGGCPSNLDLLILVVSAPRQHQWRDVIRNTWALATSLFMSSSSLLGKSGDGDSVKVKKPPRVALAFLMGVDADPMWEHLIAEEAKVESDIIQYSLRQDINQHAIETLLPLLWVQHYCAPFGNIPRYVMKCNDTQYVSIPKVEALISENLNGSDVVGYRKCSSPFTAAGKLSCLQQSSYIASGQLLSTVDLRDHKNIWDLDSQQGFPIYPGWICNKLATKAKMPCVIAKQHCAVVTNMNQSEFSEIWNRHVLFDPEKESDHC